MKAALTAALFCWSLACQAQTAPPAAGTPEAALPQRGGEPKVQRLVSEDESVRIEELRVRGITRRVSVQSKLPGAPAYQIGTNSDGRDTSQDRRSEGRALWQLFAF